VTPLGLERGAADGRPPALCGVCGGSEVAEWLEPRELMLGTRERFAYFRCAACGCLQLASPPQDLQRYYPADYYAYHADVRTHFPRSWRWKHRFLYGSMTRHRLGWGSVPGAVACAFSRGSVRHLPPAWLRFLVRPVAMDGAILDVGCGAGLQLMELLDCGFRNLRGADPFLRAPIDHGGMIRIGQERIEEIQGRFDLITLHHVFEHMAAPVAVLRQAAALLNPRGQILVRIPLADSEAALAYRENWVQLDAPRHFFLHTRRSMELAAAQAGLRISRVSYDSTAFQFWGSEQYRRDLALFDPETDRANPNISLFPPELLRAYAARAAELNASGRGDQAAFVLEK
jgi:SAM-dependent methyltransferase